MMAKTDMKSEKNEKGHTKEEVGDDLRCINMIKHYPGVLALDRLDFSAKLGEVHVILGENAAGKSTFIKTLGGSVQKDDGLIEFGGRSLAINSPGEARKLGIGVAYQELSLLPDLTVAQNIWLELLDTNSLGLLSGKGLRERTARLYDRFGAPYVEPNERVRYLDLAHRQIVEIMKCLASDPRIVIFDEATSTLPETETVWALDLCRELAHQGLITLFITHRIDEAREVADRVTILRRGKDVLSGPMSEFTDKQIVEEMLGRKAQLLYPPPTVKFESEIVLTVRDLAVGERLRQISFDLRKGEILGVGGLQGQGQVVLLLALFGILPYRGEVYVNGKLVNIRSPRDAFSVGVGLALVPEDRRSQGLLLTKSISDNISLPVLSNITRWGLLSDKAEEKLVSDAMQRIGITASSSEQIVNTLSGGNQQKVVIAKLLQVGAKILLLLDLTRGVDVGTKAEIFQLARDLTSSGHSIIMYSSENQELVNMCDRVLVLRAGKIAAELESDELTEEAIMEAAFAIERNKDATDHQVDAKID